MQNRQRLLNREYVSLFFINLVVAISFSMVSTTMALHLKNVGVEAALMGTVIGCLSIASMCVRPFSGIISDRMRKRNLLQLSLLLTAVAMVGYSLTTDVTMLIIFRAVHGIGFSFATTVTMALAAGSVPREKMTQGMGYFAIGQTIANAVAPGLGMEIGKVYGYPVSFRMAAILLGAAVGISFLCVKASPKPEKKVTHFSLHDFFAVGALPFALLSIVVAGSTGVENGFVALMGKDAGLGEIGWYFTVSAVALFASRLLIGRIADKNPRLIICAGTVSIALAFAILGGHRILFRDSLPTAAFVIAAILKALGLGAVQPALQSASIRSVDAQHRGAASCTYYLGTDVGQAMGPIFGGALAGACGYAGMFAIAAIPLVVGAVIFTMYMTYTMKRSV